MWVEIVEHGTKASTDPALDITPEPPVEFEGRFIVWKTEDIEMMDWEGTSDVFCRMFLNDPNDDYNTDTHWRCQTGKASFNWRIKFKIFSKQDKYMLTL
jgi:hypothetical protein